MPVLTANRLKQRVLDFSGGQNSGDEPSNLRANEAELLENTIITDKGKAAQRRGIVRTGDNPDTLISHWTFDASDSTDDKGSNDGTDTAVTYVDGKFGKAASFNGSTSLITVAADSTIDATSMGPFRISVWVYVDSDGESNTGRILDKFSGSDTGYRLWVHSESSSTVKLSFEVGYDSTNAIVVTSTTMSTGSWHKVDALLNSDDSVDIYIDGALASYSTDTSGSGSVNDDSSVDLIIGNKSDASLTFDGEIDDLRIYDGNFTIDNVELDTIQGIFNFKSGSTDILVRIKNTDLQRLAADFKSWTNIDTGFTADKITNFFQANDKIYIFNDTDNVHSMDTTPTVTDLGNTSTDPPRALYAEWASNNRLFVLDGYTVYFSDPLDPETFDRSSNLFRVRAGSTSQGRWLKMFKEFELIIYMDDSIFVLNMDGSTPLSDWTLKPLSLAVGCPAGRTVQDIGNDHIFLANDGVRLLSRTTFDKLRVGVISDKIKDIIDDINQDAIQNSVGWFENGRYILGVPVGTATLPNRFMIWDSRAAVRNNDPNSAWTTVPEDTWNFSCMASYSYGDNIKTVVAGEALELSLCYKVLSGNTDNGETVAQTIIGREHDFGDPFLKKEFDPVQFVAETGSDAVYNYSIDLDRSGFVSVGNSSTLAGGLVTVFTTPATTGGADHDFGNFRSKFLGRGNNARVKIVNSTYNKRPKYLEYTLYGRPYVGRLK